MNNNSSARQIWRAKGCKGDCVWKNNQCKTKINPQPGPTGDQLLTIFFWEVFQRCFHLSLIEKEDNYIHQKILCTRNNHFCRRTLLAFLSLNNTKGPWFDWLCYRHIKVSEVSYNKNLLEMGKKTKGQRGETAFSQKISF